MPDLEVCVLRICDTDGNTRGTGFVVSDGLIVTCSHVVQDEASQKRGDPRPDKVTVVFHANGARREAQVLSDFWRPVEGDDVAVLRLDEMPREAKPARLGRTLGITGHPCVTLGYPRVGAVQGVEGRGEIYRIVFEDSGRQLIQLSSKEITAGFSGAPLFDEKTERVVGMITEIAKPDRYGRLGETAFATPSEVLHSLLVPLAPDLQLYPPQAVEDYVAAVRDYCANLPYLSLHDIRPPKTLDEVYVPLKARPQPREKKSDLRGLQDLGGLERHEPLSLAEVVRSHEQPHVLILGEPGAGKSTLLRQMAESAWDALEKIGLDAPCLPILVPLRRLAGAEGSLEKRLGDALTGELALTQALPEGFFTDWPDQTGANWLILLDALDEVPTDERARLMQWLRGILKTVEPNRIVITSRLSGYSPGELDEKLFDHYDLLAFTPEQTGEFARKWFGEKADDFLRGLERVHTGDLRGTPLLLTIAAKVYLEKGALPERRSALYDQFVGIWLAEAEQRGLRAELDKAVCDVARFALARLALAMTGRLIQSAAFLSQIAAAYLRDAVPLSADRAQVVGEKFVRVMARRSGVFTRRGGEYDFIHSTFREYLAAWATVRECGRDLERIWQRMLSEEMALFALSILSDEGNDVTALVRHAWQEGGDTGLYFAGKALAEQVNVEVVVSDSIIDALLADVRNMNMLDWWYVHNALSILSELRGYVRAGAGLLALARDEQVDASVREGAAEALGNLGRADEAVPILLTLARDEKVDEQVRERAAVALGRLGRAEEAVQAWLALARDKKVDGLVRVDAATALGELGRAEEAAQAWLALVRDEKVYGWVRMHAVAALGELERAEEAASILLALAHDEKVDRWVRMDAAAALGELGRAEEAASILLALARNEKVWVWVRECAAKALGRFADARVLLDLERIVQEDKNRYVRRAAQQAIEQIRQRASQPKPVGSATSDRS